MLTLSPAKLEFTNDGTPHSSQFNDHYHSTAGAIEESQHVFIDGNQLTKVWHKQETFTIAELGFGLGINFIVTANNWLATEQSNAHLHYISIEKHPATIDQIKKVLSGIELQSEVNLQFFEDYPLAIRGHHRIHFKEAGITLTLIWDDVLHALEQAGFQANAWYLDGFSPKSNPAMWSAEIASHVHRLTQVNGTFATYSSSRLVQENFSAAGFYIKKHAGHAQKREMLTGERKHAQAVKDFPLDKKSWLFSIVKPARKKTALVIGAGMAGVAMSGALAKRGWQISLIDRHDGLAKEASGNSNAIIMPRFSLDHDWQAQLTLQGFFYTLRYLKNLQKQTSESFWQQCGAIQLPRNEHDWQRMQQIICQEKIPPELIQPVTRQQASELANCELNKDAWYLPLAAWCIPKLVCHTIQNQFTQHITFLGKQRISSLIRENGNWLALNCEQQVIARADVAVIACAFESSQFMQTEWCTLHAKRGQISLLPNKLCDTPPKKIICADAYLTPAINQHHVLGATFITNDQSTDIRQHEHEQNLSKLARITPAFSQADSNKLAGRAAIRAVSPDRMPIVGPVAHRDNFFTDFKMVASGSTNRHYPHPEYLPGLFIATGFGSRGMSWIPLCAEALACTITGEPVPLDKNLVNAIHPNRLLMRQLVKQNKQ